MYITNVQLHEETIFIYRTWENFEGGKFWRINASKAFGGENFGKSASIRSKNFTCELVSSVNQRLRLGVHPHA